MKKIIKFIKFLIAKFRFKKKDKVKPNKDDIYPLYQKKFLNVFRNNKNNFLYFSKLNFN